MLNPHILKPLSRQESCEQLLLISIICMRSRSARTGLALKRGPKMICSEISPASQFTTTLTTQLGKRDVMSSTQRLGRQSLLVKSLICARCKHRSLSTSIWRSKPRLYSLVLLATVPRTEYRNAGTKLRKSIEELPQGLQLPLEPFVKKEASKYSPLMDEVLDNQRRFPKCVLLTRVGQFYEVRWS
jgi:hypothetical protein